MSDEISKVYVFIITGPLSSNESSLVK